MKMSNLHDVFKPTVSKLNLKKLYDFTVYLDGEPVDFTTNGYWLIKTNDQPSVIKKANRTMVNSTDRSHAEGYVENFFKNQPKTELFLGKWFDISPADGSPVMRLRSRDKSVTSVVNVFFLAMIGQIYKGIEPIIKSDGNYKPVYFYDYLDKVNPFAVVMPVKWVGY